MIEIKDFKRKEIFDHYDQKDNPFLILTTKIDITNLYNNCDNKYATIGYAISKAILKTENFCYRYLNGKFYKIEKLRVSFTELDKQNNVGFFAFDFTKDYKEYINSFKATKENFKNKSYFNSVNSEEEVWFSCVPWYKMTSLITPFDKKILIPQFTWDKFEFENDKVYTNLTIMIHHGFADGYQIGLFLDNLNSEINNIK